MHAEKVQWHVLQHRFHTATLMTAAIVCSFNSSYSKGAGAFMEERQIEDIYACAIINSVQFRI